MYGIARELLKEASRFEEEADCPVSLIIKARKS
jgi:hypothetical protein